MKMRMCKWLHRDYTPSTAGRSFFAYLAIILLQGLEAALGKVEVVRWDDWVDVWELMLHIHAVLQPLE